ncbi:exodeoxyribonuclease VII small subunit [Consotaella aegiceratis]|uniref:exodeoxyribonuclease VII small subunit n=1 Tax=Consotaella aegiceratis TaxID=3097961 RepID=UPI002F41EF6A
MTDQANEQALPADDSDIRRMTFEEALAALERIVADLEHGDVPLDRSIRIYERGEKLKNHCERLLSAAEDKIEKIKVSRNGKPEGAEPLDLG